MTLTYIILAIAVLTMVSGYALQWGARTAAKAETGMVMYVVGQAAAFLALAGLILRKAGW